MNEAITDPEGNAWLDSTGFEMGDECDFVFGAPAGGSAQLGTEYNQTINGDRYYLQEEFSNEDWRANSAGGCVQSEALPVPVLTASTTHTSPNTGVTFDGGGSFGPSAFNYSWNFGDGSSQSGGSSASHAYATDGTYTVTMTTTDASGSASASAVVDVTSAPGAPAGLSASAAGNDVSLSWSASSGGDLPTGYTVYRTTDPAAEPGSALTSTSATGYIDNSVVAGMTYYYSVVAENSIGSSPASVVSVSISVPASSPTGGGSSTSSTTASSAPVVATALPPGAPTHVSVTAGDGRAVVSFVPPASNGSSPVEHYTVTVSPGGERDTVAGSPVSVVGLVDGTSYTFSVSATNRAGTGAVSTPSNRVTPLSVAHLGLVKSSSVLSGSRLVFTTTCTRAPCRGRTELTERVKIATKHGTRTEVVVVVVARGNLLVRVGSRRTIVLRLTAAGRTYLRGARRPVTAQLVTTITGGHTEQMNVRVR